MMFFFQILLAIILISTEIRRKREYSFDFCTLFSIVYFICYVVAPICGYFMASNIYRYSVMRYTMKGVQYGTESFYFAGLLSVIVYLCIQISYRIYNGKTITAYKKMLFVQDMNYRLIYKLAFFIFVLSSLVLFYFSLSSGGIFKWMVSNPRLYFENDASDVEEKSWILTKIVRSVIISCYFFWAILLYKIEYKVKSIKFYIYFLFLFSFLFSVIVVFHSGGRFLFFQFFAILFLTYILFKRKKINVLKVSLITVFGAFVLLYSRYLFQFLIYDDVFDRMLEKEQESVADRLFGVINNYTFPFFSSINNIDRHLSYTGEWNMFRDIFLWPVNFLPQSYRPDFVFDSTAINTHGLMGEYTRFIPSDIISYGLINFGFIGVILVAFLFGIVLKYFNNCIIYTKNNPFAAVIYLILAFLVCFRIMYFDPYHLIKGAFEILVCVFIIPIITPKKIRR